MLKLLIIDDEPPARKELRFLIESITEAVQIFEARNYREALETIRNQWVDACFIDINLGDNDGITLAQELSELQQNLKIVFATAYDAYAVKAFELNALDYILKPFEQDRVAKALERIQNGIASGQTSSEADHLHNALTRMTEKLRKLSVWDGDRLILVDMDQIVFISTSDRNCRICTCKSNYLSTQPLSYFEEKFKNSNFLRANRSYLVNLDHILEIVPWFNHAYLLKMRQYEAEEIIISRNKIKDFRLLFDF